MSKQALFLALCMASPIVFGASEVPLTDDSMILEGSSETFGSSEVLNIGGGYTTYLKFSLDERDSTLDAGIGSIFNAFDSTIEKAILTIYAAKDSAVGEVVVNQVSNKWNEETLNDGNKPDIILTGEARGLSPSKFVSFDVTDMVRGAHSIGDKNVSFSISHDFDQINTIDSKENEATSHQARLFIKEEPLAGVSGPAGKDGEKGDKGDTGDKGETGVKGDTGAKGERGEKGAKGEKGEKGEKGLDGAAAAKGDKGDKGERGERGDKGEKGERGDKGEKGERGEKGEKGERGLDGKDGVCDCCENSLANCPSH